MTTLAIIGLGNMGKGLARRLAGKIDLLIATRELAAAEAFVAELPGSRTRALTTDAAIASAATITNRIVPPPPTKGAPEA